MAILSNLFPDANINPESIIEAQALAFDLADATEKARTTAFSFPITGETIKEAVHLNGDRSLPSKERRAELATMLGNATEAMENFNNIAQLALLFPIRVMMAINQGDEAGLRNLIREANKALNTNNAPRLHTIKVDATETIIEVHASSVSNIADLASHIAQLNDDVRSANVMGTKHVDTRFKSGDFHLVASIARKEDGITALSVWGRDGDNQMINLEDNETAKAFIRHLEKLRD